MGEISGNDGGAGGGSEVHAAETGVEGGAGDAEDAGGAGDVAEGPLQEEADVSVGELLEGGKRRPGGRGGGRRALAQDFLEEL